MADVIMAHDGTVDEFIEVILALFGAPVSKSDDSERAFSVLLKCNNREH